MSDLEAAKMDLDKAFMERDVSKIRQTTTADHVAVIANHTGPMTKDQMVANLAKYHLTSFESSDVVVTMLSPDVALLNFNVKQSGTYDGIALPTRVFVSEVWLRRDGQWLQRLFQSTELSG
jgi:hypothetical protein